MVPVRRRLFLLAAAALAPLAGIAALGLIALVTQQRQQAARGGIELTRALATAVGAELGRSVAVLAAMATSSTLDSGELETFHRRATRVAETQKYWRAIVLVDAAGAPMLDTRVPFGTPPPAFTDVEGVARVTRTGAPVVGNLADHPIPGDGTTELALTVVVPVLRDEALRYAVVGVVKPDAIVDILQRQRVPSDWVISIFDAGGRRVARSRLHAETVGKPGAPSVVALMAQPEDEGWGRTIAVEGDPIYTAYSRVKDVGWTVATGIPVGMVDGAAWRSGLILGGGLLLSILIGGVAALLVGRSIAEPVAALRTAAQALGRREPLAPPVTTIQEIRQVAEALVGAADERARAEAEREELLRREQQARAAAEAANRAKDEFLAMLGHELRNPLGAITNAIGLLEHATAQPVAAERARAIIARQAAHLARLTDDLLDAGRAITGKIVLDRKPIELATTVSRALAAFPGRDGLAERHIVSDLHPVWIDADATRIEQIVANLVGNAVKYTARDGTIRVWVGQEDGLATLRVRDDGIGMTPDLSARVFDLFVQGERALDRAAGGLGIGLTLVQRIAGLHGGGAAATSGGPGQGAEIRVWMPAVAAPTDAGTASAPAPPLGVGRDVLIVEDNDDARTALAELLTLGGHRVRTECDGLAGLATALAVRPEVVLVDVGLPGIDGYELARRLRAAGDGGHRMLLIALTGYGLADDRQRALAAGFDLHLVKPVDLAALAAVLATMSASSGAGA